MRKLKLSLWAIVFMFLASGCANITNRYMEIKKPSKDYRPEAGKALLIFEREWSGIAWPYTAYLWDMTNKAKPKILGYLDRGMRTAYSVDPGEYIFMSAFTGTAHMMKANVEAGKTYFVFMEMKMAHGLWFIPIKAGQDNPIELDKISEPNEKILNWAKQPENISSALKAFGKAQIVWNEMDAEEKARRTLEPQDGR